MSEHDSADPVADKSLTGEAGHTDVIRSEVGPVAGKVVTPGIDDVLDALESEEDVVAANRRLLEGAPQTREQLDRWRTLLTETRDECNKRIMTHGVFLAAAAPNPNGLGACFFGMDQELREYTVTLNFPAVERDDFDRASKEDFVRWAIDAICSELVAQRNEYLRRMGRS